MYGRSETKGTYLSVLSLIALLLASALAWGQSSAESLKELGLAVTIDRLASPDRPSHRAGAQSIVSSQTPQPVLGLMGPECSSGPTILRTLSPNVIYQVAEMLFREKDYEDAAVQYRLLLRTKPDFHLAPRCRIKVALCYMSAGRYAEAQDALDSILEDGSLRGYWEEASFWQAFCFYVSEDILSSLERLTMLLEDSTDADVKAYSSYLISWVYLVRGEILPASKLLGRLAQSSGAAPGLSEVDLASLSRDVLGMESLTTKSPAVAGLLSSCLPGAGHFYCKRYADGLVALGLNAAFAAAAVESFDKRIYVAGGIASSVELVWYSGTIYGAVNAAHRFNRSKRDEFIEGLRRKFGDERTILIERLYN